MAQINQVKINGYDCMFELKDGKVELSLNKEGSDLHGEYIVAIDVEGCSPSEAIISSHNAQGELAAALLDNLNAKAFALAAIDLLKDAKKAGQTDKGDKKGEIK